MLSFKAVTGYRSSVCGHANMQQQANLANIAFQEGSSRRWRNGKSLCHLSRLQRIGREKIAGEILLYITPPDRTDVIDRYFALGADRIACSLEVWDDALGAVITPGKREITTKKRHLDALTYIAEKFGPGKALCNFIIGLEPLESLTAGATYLAERGIIPNASVWMPFGKPVMGSMKTPSVDYFGKAPKTHK